MPDREKVITALAICTGKCKCFGCWYGQNNPDFRCQDRLKADALTLLREQEPRVMTLDELYDAEYVFYEDNRTGVLCLLPSGDDEYEIYFTSRHCDIIQRRKDNYKKSWRCWTVRPTDEQREAVKWDD